VRTSDCSERVLVDFRHVDGGTESFAGFYESELRPLP